MISTSCAIVVISDNYADPSFLPFRGEANCHIYLELLQLVQTKQEAINCCKDRAIIVNIDYYGCNALGHDERAGKG
jgi:hypothetical protein